MFQFDVMHVETPETTPGPHFDLEITHWSGGQFRGVFRRADLVPLEEWLNFCRLFTGTTVDAVDTRGVQSIHVAETGDIVIDCGDAIVTIPVAHDDTATCVAFEQLYYSLEAEYKKYHMMHPHPAD